MSHFIADNGGSRVLRAIDAVNDFITQGQMRVGDTLPGEGHFAQQLGVSRAVMREAFGKMAALKMLDVANGRKARVGAIDGSVMATGLAHAVSTDQVSIAEIWDVRRTLEVRTAALAAIHRSDNEAEQILELAAAMARDMADMARVSAHDIAFHDAIAKASHNGLFVQIVQSFTPMMGIAVPAAWHTRQLDADRQTMLERHFAIATAIAERDEIAAGNAMQTHFDESVGALLTSSPISA